MLKNIVVLFIFLTACSQNGAHIPVPDSQGGENTNGVPGTNTTQGTGSGHRLSYEDVKPIFAKHCASCHPSRSQPNWLNYQSALPVIKQGLLKQKLIVAQSMPPPGSPQARNITDAERQKIATWLSQGYPETVARTTDNQNHTDSGSDFETSPTDTSTVTNSEPTAPSYVQSCLGCHTGSDPSTPVLQSQSSAYLKKQLNDFKWLKRIDPTGNMNKTAILLSDETIETISLYFSNQDPIDQNNAEPLNNSIKEQFQLGQLIAHNACNSCHMSTHADDKPLSQVVPFLKGQSRGYLAQQLILFQQGKRKSGVMETLSKKLSKEDIEAIAVYYSHL